MIVAADLFAGLGGFTTGAEATGRVRVQVAANHWPDAVKWHELNHPATDMLCQDVQQMDMRQLPNLVAGLLLAAPSCKGHSEAGQPAAAGTGGSHAPDRSRIHDKHTADRNTAWAVLAAADTARPAVIVVENVPAFTRWELYKPWLDVLKAMGYHVRAHTLDARSFGAAQHRVRWILTAGLAGPIDLEPGCADPGTISDLLDPDDLPGNRWADIASKPSRMLPRMRKAQREAGARCVWNNVSESSGRPLDGQLPTLTTQAGTQLYLLDGERCRILNPRELARGQGFPEHYRIPTNRRLASKLIGNAISVHMAQGVTEQVLAAAF